MNDDLFREGLTTVNRRTIDGGDSNASTWQEWAFAPIRFEGMTKHSMASSLRAVFHNRQAAIPIFDDDGEVLGTVEDPKWRRELRPEAADAQEWRDFVRQVSNIKQVPNNSGSYPSYKMVNPKLGDDYFDAACAAVWGLCRAGQAH